MMKQTNGNRLDVAIQVLVEDGPEASELAAAAQRVAGRLLASGGATWGVDWSLPTLVTAGGSGSPRGNPLRYTVRASWAMACLVVLVAGFLVYRAYWQVPPGVQAHVESVDGSAYLITGTAERVASSSDNLMAGQLLRTGGGSHAVLRLADGSRIEVNQRTEFGIRARGADITVVVDNGNVIVQAAKRKSGHLYVSTPDCRVAVTGTVFAVNAGIKGSRVAVLEGAVHVLHAGIDTSVQAGAEIATSSNLTSLPIADQIAWSRDRDRYLLQLAQLSMLRQRLDQIPLPQPRYSSDLLPRVPIDTLLYVSFPNIGDFVSQANETFNDQLQKSPALQEWWGRGGEQNKVELSAAIGRLHGISQYLGDEIVLVSVNGAKAPEMAMVADVKQPGLADFLKSGCQNVESACGVNVIDENGLASLPQAAEPQPRLVALVREHEVILGGSRTALTRVNAQLNAGSSGFANSTFGGQIAAAYSRGAGFILAADLQQIVINHLPAGAAVPLMSGLADVRYLIAEHREQQGEPENTLRLQFAGARQGAASWLATSAPIGSSDFVTPSAAFVFAFLSKDPKLIVDDIANALTAANPVAQQQFAQLDEALQISLRDDLAAHLGGDALLSLDGPVLPFPSWKAVVEVHDPEKLEQTLEDVAVSLRALPHAKSQNPSISWEDIAGQRFYLIRDLHSARELMHYTFKDGYMILAPNRALLMEALQVHSAGTSIARSAAFKALLPAGENDNCSAVVYQNLAPVLTPLLPQLGQQVAAAAQQLAAEAKPGAICAQGNPDSIELTSNSRLSGLDFLTLGALLNNRNKLAESNVKGSHGSN